VKPFINEIMQLAVNGSFAASVLLKVTITTVLALVGTRLALRSPASVRHALLAASFALLIALPISSALAPPVRITVPIAVQQETVRSSFPVITPDASYDSMRSVIISIPTTIPQSRWPAVSTLLFVMWMVGTIVFLLPIAAGLWQTRSLRRTGIPWREGKSVVDSLAIDAGIRRRIGVFLHESVPGPMTFGAVRPTIMLPIDAQSWPSEELSRALVHELEHIRRSDWISRCVARVVCACYWFHPCVWFTWRQFVLEAERACDDAVLRRADATAYAEQLVVLAQRLLTRPNQPVLAMANRYDLGKRVSALLDTRQRRGRAGIVRVALACTITALVVTTISPLDIAARIQTPSQATDGRRFEVASVKPCRDEDFRNGGQRRQEVTYSPGRITINCIGLARIIYFAYAGIGSMNDPLINDHPGDPSHVRGGPEWIRTETFYIEAKAEGTPDRTVMMGPMLRALLEEHFKLKTHRELEQVPMYAMTVAKGGLKTKPLEEGGCRSFDEVKDLPPQQIGAMDMGAKPVCGNFTSLGDRVTRKWSLGGTTLARFANQTLSSVLDRHVMDNTGVDGTFNIKLEFGYDENIKEGVFGGRPVGPIDDPPPGVERGPSIFTALEQQLGLKLEKANGPRGFLVIDSAQRLQN